MKLRMLAALLLPAEVMVSSMTCTDLPGLPNAYQAEAKAYGINEGGWVVGTTRGYFDGVTWVQTTRAILWQGTTPMNLGTLAPAYPSRGSRGRDVNDAGVATGYALAPNANGLCCYLRGFVWMEGEGIEALPNLGFFAPIENQYIYIWKTQKSWAGTCRRLVVRLNDGTERYADFSFDG